MDHGDHPQERKRSDAGREAEEEENRDLTPCVASSQPPNRTSRWQTHVDCLLIACDLVAAHAWDIVGALRAGCAAAFVARPGKVLYPLGPKPDITGPDFKAVATLIVAAEAI